MGSNNKNIERWCEYTIQASYTMNATLYREIDTTPYEAVFGITAHRENHQNTDEDIKCQGETTELASGKNTLDNDKCETFERAAKRQKIRQRQSQYNEEMVKQTSRSRKAPFKIDDMVAVATRIGNFYVSIALFVVRCVLLRVCVIILSRC